MADDPNQANLKDRYARISKGYMNNTGAKTFVPKPLRTPGMEDDTDAPKTEPSPVAPDTASSFLPSFMGGMSDAEKAARDKLKGMEDLDDAARERIIEKARAAGYFK